MDDMLELFEGLTPRQAETLRKLIVPTLMSLKYEVIWLDQHADQIHSAAKELTQEASHE